MKVIVGLGNPGPKYQLTRHNIGFILIDALVMSVTGQRNYKSEFKAETQKFQFGGESVVVAKPQTFMNLSGESVQPLLHFYGVDLKDLLVIHDEVDIPFGQMRFQEKRGHGGHNGIRNIHQMLGSNEYGRLRLGVGRPTIPEMPVHEWVLANFSKEEQSQLPKFMDIAIDGIETWIKSGLSQASTLFNSRTL